MRHKYFAPCALLAFLACGPAFAVQQALITIDPNNFAPGTDISNATAGATLRSVNFVPNPDPNAPPQQSFIPQFAPLFAEMVTAGCVLESVPPTLPCAPVGNSVFGYTSSSTAQSLPDFWGPVRPAIGCFDPSQGTCFEAVIFPLLRVDFAVPTDLVSVVMANFTSSDGDLEAFSSVAAFDETGQNIGTCTSGAPGLGTGCSGTVVAGPDFNGETWMRVTFSDPSARIRFIVTGATVDAVPLGSMQFDSPVSVQLAGLFTHVQGVGPGKSLANTVMQVQADYAAGDTQTTCSLLDSFVGEVNAQNGKHIGTLTDARLLSTATAIKAGIGCH